MEASALSHTARAPQALIPGRSPLLRLQSDERLIALVRDGHPGAFDALVQRYQARLLAFLRHMLSSPEDAEDVLQEVFASAYNAIRADTREINARPWLYRIARNRALNHLRRPVPAGQDTMDVFERAAGETTADAVHKREDFRQLIDDVQGLPETQRTALLMREIDALSYEQIAEAMETTVPSVKSLLVRARVGLAEAAEARMISCGEVRLALGEAAEGISKLEAPVRRHVKECERCRAFKAELRRTSRALAAIYPVGPFVFLHKLMWGKVGGGATGGSTGSSGVAGGSTFAGGSAVGGGAAASGGALSGFVGGGVGAGSVLSAGAGAIAAKAAAGLVAAAVVTAGAVEVARMTDGPPSAPHHSSSPPLEGDATAPVAALPSSGSSVPGAPTAANPPPDPASGDTAGGGAAEPAPTGGEPAPADPAGAGGTDVVGPAPPPSHPPALPDTGVSDGGTSGGSPPAGGGDDVSGSDGGISPPDDGGSSSGDGSEPPADPGGGGSPGAPPVVGDPAAPAGF